MADADGADFTAFYRQHYAGIVRTVRPIAHGAAEDVAQDAFTALYERWTTVSTYDNPWSWVALVAKRLATRRIGRDARQVPTEHIVGSTQDCPRDIDVWAAVSTLPTRQASAVTLHHLWGWPLADVADHLGCTAAAARVLVHRGRRLAAGRLGGYAGRWASESNWTVDAVVAHLRAGDAAVHVGVVVDQHLQGRGGRWELTLGHDTYLLQREDGLRLDEGAFALKRGRIVLSPTAAPGSVTLDGTVDGERLSARLLEDTTPSTDGVPDEVWVRLFLESSPFTWCGPVDRVV